MSRRRRIAAALAVLLMSAAVARADPPDADDAALLQHFSDQTQRLYARGRLGTVRVRLPTPQWLARENQLRQFIAQWGGQLDPAVRQRLLEEQAQAAYLASHVGPAPASGGAIPPWPPVGGLTLTPPSPLNPGPLVVVAPDRVLIATGVLVDTAGHVVFPLYIDRADLTAGLGGRPPSLPALTGDGRATVATFVGSDQKTNLTVLQLADPDGPATRPSRVAPLPMAADVGRPPDGSVALVVAPDASAHLSVWTAASADVGLVLRPDGTFAGFGFTDDFLSMATARPVVDQLIATGTVRRPVLGVAGVGLRRTYLFDPAVLAADDADATAGPSAVYVRAVEPDSAAARAGLRAGDVVLSIAGQSVGPRTFAAAIAACHGRTVLRVRRGSATQDLGVDLKAE